MPKRRRKQRNAHKVRCNRRRPWTAPNCRRATYEKFGLLAEKLSDDDFRVNMGYRKPVEVAKLPPAIAKLLTSMKPGQVSDIVNIDGGYTILRLIDHNPPTTRKFLDVKTELKKHLEEQKQEELRSALNERLRAKAKVEEL